LGGLGVGLERSGPSVANAAKLKLIRQANKVTFIDFPPVSVFPRGPK
jgi:hypothetical protein